MIGADSHILIIRGIRAEVSDQIERVQKECDERVAASRAELERAQEALEEAHRKWESAENTADEMRTQRGEADARAKQGEVMSPKFLILITNYSLNPESFFSPHESQVQHKRKHA